MPASELSAGEQLRTAHGTATLESVSKVPGMHRVYNLEVETDHRYFAGAAGVLSHNATYNSRTCGPNAPPRQKIPGTNIDIPLPGEPLYVGPHKVAYPSAVSSGNAGPPGKCKLPKDDQLTPHHIPQHAVAKHVPHPDGVTISIPKGLHKELETTFRNADMGNNYLNVKRDISTLRQKLLAAGFQKEIVDYSLSKLLAEIHTGKYF